MDKRRLVISVLVFLSIAYFLRTSIFANSNDFLLLFSIYLLGQMLRRFPGNWIESHAINIFVFTNFINFLIIFSLSFMSYGKAIQYITGSKNPITIISSISLFYVFLNLRNVSMISCYVAKLAPYMLSVYILHESLRISGVFDISFLQGRLEYIFPLSCLILILICTFEMCRNRLMKKFEEISYCYCKGLILRLLSN